ncbi:hypothetical protein ANCCEY_12151 [Ancylostoma ceylanicum]|uniref:Uncharacterized protein n=1 Tax=Ancylostoma ceylanicum TaxID=53326 RepID=A0A0D6LFR6_9BILA|nr:hypothetical protein ANCCEY_12151 [Ancylostoma ceylanicum]
MQVGTSGALQFPARVLLRRFSVKSFGAQFEADAALHQTNRRYPMIVEYNNMRRTFIQEHITTCTPQLRNSHVTVPYRSTLKAVI